MTTAQDPAATPPPLAPVEVPPVSAEDAPDATVLANMAGNLAEILRGSMPLAAEGPVAAVPSGDLDITFGGSIGKVRLPRPLFGQMKVLIRAQGRVADELRAIEQRGAAYRNKFVEDLKQIADPENPGNVDLQIANLEVLANVRDEARDIANQGEDATEAALVEFWTLVFATLMDGVAYDTEKWPSDLLDPTLPGKVINHWRHAQPGPG